MQADEELAVTASRRAFFDKSCFEALFAAFFAGLYIGIFYTLNNLTILRPEGILVLFSLMILPLMALTLLVYSLCYVLGKVERAPVLIVFLASAFLIFMLYPALLGIDLVRRYFHFFQGEYVLANALFIFVIAALLSFVFQKKMEIFAVLLGLMSVTQVVMGFGGLTTGSSSDEKAHKPGSQLQTISLKQKPNIYFILADGFGSFAYMKEHGVDVSQFTEQLSSQGFRLYEDAYSNYQPTTSAMPAMLDMEHHYYTLNEMRVHFSEVSVAARRVIAGDNNVSHLLRNNGYTIEYIHNGTYLLLQGCSADSCFPELDRLVGAKIILSHIFKRDLLSVQDKASRYDSVDAIPVEVARLMDSRPSGPRFQYIHAFTPNHSPNKVAGICDEALELTNYEERVNKASSFMLSQIEDIVSRDPEAVIILAGDHGPFISNKCAPLARINSAEEYRDRAGILMAVRWPASYRGEYDDQIVTGVNLFRFVLASLAADNAPLVNSVAADDVFVRERSGHVFRVIKDGAPLDDPQRIQVQYVKK